MPIQIIPKEAAKLPLWQNILFYISLILLLTSVSCYFVLAHFQKKSDSILKTLEEVLSKGKAPQQIALENEVLDYQKKIDDFAVLINTRQTSSRFFDFVEGNTHPQVSFSELKLDNKGNKVILFGETENFETLGQQILIFQKNEMVKNLNLSEIEIGKEGKIEFSLEILLYPKIFK